MKNVTPPDAPGAQPGLPPKAGQRKRPGRPPLLTDHARDILLGHMRNGARLQVAARMAGIAPSTAEEWKRRGEGLDDRPATPFYRQFAEDISLARAEWEAKNWAALGSQRALLDPEVARRNLLMLPEVMAEQRALQAPPPPPPDAPVVPAFGPNIVVLSPEMLERIALQQLASRKESPDGDAIAAARARLVEDTGA